MTQRPHPYVLIADERKTTLSASGGVVLGYGPGPGLRHSIFWNRIGSLFSCYRPAVALLTVFDAADPHTPLALQTISTQWHPNHCEAQYSALLSDGSEVHISEDRYGTATGLACRLRFAWSADRRSVSSGSADRRSVSSGSADRRSVSSSAGGAGMSARGPASEDSTLESEHTKQGAAPQVRTRAGTPAPQKKSTGHRPALQLILCFHGLAQQWAFFDYMRRSTAEELAQGRPPGFEEPLINCAIEPAQGLITLRQPHPHDGLLKPAADGSGRLEAAVNSIQRVWLDRPLTGGGFCASESELHTLWHEHGVESSIRMRLGQVGGRWSADQWSAKGADGSSALQYSHRAPLYYLTTRLTLTPDSAQDVAIQSDFHTDDPGGDLRPSAQLEWEAKHSRPYKLTSKAIDRELACEEKAWRRYLDSDVPQLECSDKPLERYWYYVWYVLRANRTAPGAHITAPFTAPSKYMYWGPWIWDAYFHVLGERWLKDPSIAKDSVRAVLQMQFPNGFIPVCSGSQYRMCFHEDVPGYRSPTGGGYASYVPGKLRGYKEDAHPFEASFSYLDHAGKYRLSMSHNEKTQTPLITRALFGYALLYQDWDFLRESSRPLQRFDDWLARRRTDEHGRFVLWHGDESGWDDATRHYPVPALPYDVQVHCLQQAGLLKSLNEFLKNKPVPLNVQDRTSWLKWSRSQPQWLREQRLMFALDTYRNEQDDWHHDLDPGFPVDSTKRFRRQIAPSGLLDIDATVISRQGQGKPLLAALKDPAIFARPYPIPTLAANDPDYRPHGWGWNGPVWLQVNYFVLCGLISRNQYQPAFELWERTRALIIRDDRPHSYELYDPELGTGMGCPDYSWQAMIINLIIERFAGVRDRRLLPVLPPGISYLRITQLPGRISSVELRRSTGGTTQLQLSMNSQDSYPWNGVPENYALPINTGNLGNISSASVNGAMAESDGEGNWFIPKRQRKASIWEIRIECQRKK